VRDYRIPELLASLKGMQTRIRELDALTRKLGAHSIFVTQRSGRWHRQNGTIFGIPSYITPAANEFDAFGKVNGVDIYHVEKIFADAAISVCKSVQAICVNLMDEIAFDPGRDFYDSVHTNATGAKAIGEYLYQQLRNRI
jgi:lysophospholipase L1-like esterase